MFKFGFFSFPNLFEIKKTSQIQRSICHRSNGFTSIMIFIQDLSKLPLWLFSHCSLPSCGSRLPSSQPSCPSQFCIFRIQHFPRLHTKVCGPEHIPSIPTSASYRPFCCYRTTHDQTDVLNPREHSCMLLPTSASEVEDRRWDVSHFMGINWW